MEHNAEARTSLSTFYFFSEEKGNPSSYEIVVARVLEEGDLDLSCFYISGGTFSEYLSRSFVSALSFLELYPLSSSPSSSSPLHSPSSFLSLCCLLPYRRFRSVFSLWRRPYNPPVNPSFPLTRHLRLSHFISLRSFCLLKFQILLVWIF